MAPLWIRPIVAAAVSATNEACTARNSPLATLPAISSATRRAGDRRILLVDLAGGRVGDQVGHECCGRGPQGVADRVQVGGDPLAGGCLRRDRGFDFVGRGPEEMAHDIGRYLFLGLPERVEGGLGAVPAGGQMGEGEVPEALGEKQRHELVKQLLTAVACRCGRAGGQDGPDELADRGDGLRPGPVPSSAAATRPGARSAVGDLFRGGPGLRGWMTLPDRVPARRRPEACGIADPVALCLYLCRLSSGDGEIPLPSHGAAPQKRALSWLMTCEGHRVPVDEFHQRGLHRPDEPALIDSPSGYHSACTYQGLYVLAVVQDLPGPGRRRDENS
jgi:hypothetical protein